MGTIHTIALIFTVMVCTDRRKTLRAVQQTSLTATERILVKGGYKISLKEVPHVGSFKQDINKPGIT